MKISRIVVNAASETRDELAPFLNNLDFRVFSRYNVGYLRYKQNPTMHFIDLEVNRFLHTANYIYNNFPTSARILDIGVFIPVLPIMLSKLGYQIEAVEKLSFYENTLDAILEYVSKTYNIKIHNIDIINGNSSALQDKFNIVLLMAILEHLNGSPKKLLEKCKSFLNLPGYLFVDVPNVASLPKRISFFIKGKPPFPEYSDYFFSDYPFEGHNREYSLKELRFALTSTGFEVSKTESLNLPLHPRANIYTRIMKKLSSLGPNSWREILWAVSKVTDSE